MSEQRLFMVEDVWLRAGQASAYLANMGSKPRHEPPHAWDLVGVFNQKRIAGEWPSAVNLWQMSWSSLAGRMRHQFGNDAPREEVFERWWTKSSGERSAGWDRVLLPGEGCPELFDLQAKPLGRCLIQIRTAVRPGASIAHLAWLESVISDGNVQGPWSPFLWMRAVHSSETFLYLAGHSWSGVELATRAFASPPAAFKARATASLLHSWDRSRYLFSDGQ